MIHKTEGADSFYAEVRNGKTDPIAAFTLGKLKVEGSVEKALKIKELVHPCTVYVPAALKYLRMKHSASVPAYHRGKPT